MSKVLVVVFLIFGTVVGSGFSSGKEIYVYFSRFGAWSYLYIAIATVLFFFLFRFFLKKGEKVFNLLQKSKILNVCVGFISLIFCASMFAGVRNLFSYLPPALDAVLMAVLVVCCLVVTIKGMRGLTKFNRVVMPATTLLFLIVLVFCATKSSGQSMPANPYAGMLFCPLYVALNTCMSGLVFSQVRLSKKQIDLACGFSALLIFVFLMLGNFVLQRNGNSYFAEMPFLFLAGGNKVMFLIAHFVILVGCFTTLISLSYTLKTSLEKQFKNGKGCALVAVLLPFLVSMLGFSQIVSLLYPICSVLGIFILLVLLLTL